MGAYLDKKGIAYEIIDLAKGELLPQEIGMYDALIVLGGPMNVYEEKQYSFLKAEDDFIKELLNRKIPYLGICLGAQLLAKAAGAKVSKAAQKEVGFSKIKLSLDGSVDPIFEGIGKEFDVFQWHEDTFSIPKGAKHLASSSVCVNQALRVGPCAYGVQFHVEITDKSIKEWSNAYIKEQPDFLAQKNKMLDDYGKIKVRFDTTAERLYDNFFKIVAAQKVSG